MAADIRISSKGAPILERALVVDPVTANARLLGDILRTLSLCQVQVAPTDTRALAMARDFDPQVIFVELAATGVDGLDLTRRLRRSEGGHFEVLPAPRGGGGGGGVTGRRQRQRQR